MAVFYTATVSSVDYGFNFIDKEIEIDALADKAVSVNLKIAIREAEASEPGIVFDQIVNTVNPTTLDPVGPIETDLSLILLDTWRVLSLKTSGVFTLAGGNNVNELTGVDVFAPNNLVTLVNNVSQASTQ